MITLRRLSAGDVSLSDTAFLAHHLRPNKARSCSQLNPLRALWSNGSILEYIFARIFAPSLITSHHLSSLYKNDARKGGLRENRARDLAPIPAKPFLLSAESYCHCWSNSPASVTTKLTAPSFPSRHSCRSSTKSEASKSRETVLPGPPMAAETNHKLRKVYVLETNPKHVFVPPLTRADK